MWFEYSTQDCLQLMSFKSNKNYVAYGKSFQTKIPLLLDVICFYMQYIFKIRMAKSVGNIIFNAILQILRWISSSRGTFGCRILFWDWNFKIRYGRWHCNWIWIRIRHQNPKLRIEIKPGIQLGLRIVKNHNQNWIPRQKLPPNHEN